ncbi:plasmid pRiA4b ORF-3 family protein [Paraliobacillus sediminis]|uniref:plasmid pRiA4b ORF-3 family protein n=1 Tax=Paraliobacillus sediminis TaxID=1885916 RepID=UPI000E3C9CA1|nr:plasmid pRiA4b ORF-3 family protein [Paraliobacillus sediminis]
MLIQCTKKLLTELKLKPTVATEEEPLFSWHANILTVNRRKTLVLMNDSNRYIIVLYGLKAKDFKKIDELIVQAIREIYQKENIKEEVIEAFIAQSKEITFTSTKNRQSVARLNKACENVYVMEDDLDQNSMYQVALSKRASRLIVGSGNNEYVKPNEALCSDLEGLAKGPIYYSEAIVLKVTLELKNASIWRRIVVPKRMTFPDLHKTLQRIFNWHDYHLHNFAIFAGKPFDPDRMKSKENRIPVANIVCDEEFLEHDSDIPEKIETGERISDYLPAEITYIYDFGDDWRHNIVVEDFINDYDLSHPTCLAGEGDAPPEDVGGEHGYEMFLEIIEDPTHPDHQHMESWGESQGYEKFDIEMTNRRLKYI